MVVPTEPPEDRGEDAPSAAAAEGTRITFDAPPAEVPPEVRDVSFPGAVRGYDRRAVDAYVERVNRVIAELEVSRSPQAAVRHALDRVGQQTSGVLQRAREAAEELTTSALADAEQAMRRASTEADELLEEARMSAHQLRGEAKQQADEILAAARRDADSLLQRAREQANTLEQASEARLRELRSETESAADARGRLLEELRRTAAEIERFASGALDQSQGEERTTDGGDPPTEPLRPQRPARRPRGEQREGGAGAARARETAEDRSR